MVPTRSGLTENARRSGQTPFIGCLVNQTLVGQTKAPELALRHPLHGEFLALLDAVEKIEIDQPLVRKAGFVGQAFEIVHDLRTQVDSELFLSAQGFLSSFNLEKSYAFFIKSNLLLGCLPCRNDSNHGIGVPLTVNDDQHSCC